jgi:hypothetical protein
MKCEAENIFNFDPELGRYDEVWLSIEWEEILKFNRNYCHWKANRNLDLLVLKIIDETEKEKIIQCEFEY